MLQLPRSPTPTVCQLRLSTLHTECLTLRGRETQSSFFKQLMRACQSTSQMTKVRPSHRHPSPLNDVQYVHLGNTLLMLAAYAGHAELTKGLLQRKADPNRLNDLGQSIIAGAVFKSHDEVVRILAEAGADPRIGKPTAIEAAHIFGRKELMEVLGAKQGDIGTDVPTPPSARPEK